MNPIRKLIEAVRGIIAMPSRLRESQEALDMALRLHDRAQYNYQLALRNVEMWRQMYYDAEEDRRDVQERLDKALTELEGARGEAARWCTLYSRTQTQAA